VRRRSLILDTLAFSKGEIFILIVLAVLNISYRYISLQMQAQLQKLKTELEADSSTVQSNRLLLDTIFPKLLKTYSREDLG
jgi:predicted nuclease of predicted toxin-antitoxin system